MINVKKEIKKRSTAIVELGKKVGAVPNGVGLVGLLQPLADGLKLVLKETIIPIAANKEIFIIAPILTFTISLLYASNSICNITCLSLVVAMVGVIYITEELLVKRKLEGSKSQDLFEQISKDYITNIKFYDVKVTKKATGKINKKNFGIISVLLLNESPKEIPEVNNTIISIVDLSIYFTLIILLIIFLVKSLNIYLIYTRSLKYTFRHCNEYIFKKVYNRDILELAVVEKLEFLKNPFENQYILAAIDAIDDDIETLKVKKEELEDLSDTLEELDFNKRYDTVFEFQEVINKLAKTEEDRLYYLSMINAFDQVPQRVFEVQNFYMFIKNIKIAEVQRQVDNETEHLKELMRELLRYYARECSIFYYVTLLIYITLFKTINFFYNKGGSSKKLLLSVGLFGLIKQINLKDIYQQGKDATSHVINGEFDKVLTEDLLVVGASLSLIGVSGYYTWKLGKGGLNLWNLQLSTQYSQICKHKANSIYNVDYAELSLRKKLYVASSYSNQNSKVLSTIKEMGQAEVKMKDAIVFLNQLQTRINLNEIGTIDDYNKEIQQYEKLYKIQLRPLKKECQNLGLKKDNKLDQKYMKAVLKRQQDEIDRIETNLKIKPKVLLSLETKITNKPIQRK